MSRDHPNNSTGKIDQNTIKSHGDLLSLKLKRKTISWCWFENLSKEKSNNDYEINPDINRKW